MSGDPDPAAHWDAAYGLGDTTRSWFQSYPAQSLRMLDAGRVTATDSIIDVGGGASTFVDALLDRGHTDVTVLDVSAHALQIAQQRLGADAGRVHWLAADLLAWRPERTYQVWHDRAVLHFLGNEQARERYLHALNHATAPGAVAIFATFAPDGPRYCSGLPVARYAATDLATILGEHWTSVAVDREEHTTPSGLLQPFTWAAFRRRPSLG